MTGRIMVMVPEEEWSQIRETQLQILDALKSMSNKGEEVPRIKNITAIEFMAAVRIRRTKFDQLVEGSKIKIIKEGRKIYVPVSEIDRHFNDRTI